MGEIDRAKMVVLAKGVAAAIENLHAYARAEHNWGDPETYREIGNLLRLVNRARTVAMAYAVEGWTEEIPRG